MAHDLVTELLQYSSLACFMPIWQLCANLLIPNCLRSNLSYSPLAALELYVTIFQTMIYSPLPGNTPTIGKGSFRKEKLRYGIKKITRYKFIPLKIEISTERSGGMEKLIIRSRSGIKKGGFLLPRMAWKIIKGKNSMDRS